MAWRRVLTGAAWLAAIVASGCAQTTRVDEGELSPARLSQSRKAVAVMRIGAGGSACDNVAVLLGVREGAGFRRHTPLRVSNVRSLSEPAVAEVELDPGEYHVVAYACSNAKGHRVVQGRAGDDVASDGGHVYRWSYTSFRLEPGEVVNVGYLHIDAAKVGRSQLGRPLRIEVAVTDWPLAELERYKAKRPAVYAQMKTRLMKIELGDDGPPGAEDCAKLRQLKAEGKVQTLPKACA
jgi:hypothetical protein